MPDILMLRYGNLLYFSPDGSSPVPKDVVELFHPHLSYDQRKFLFGWKARDPITGQKRNVEITEKRLYGVDKKGRLFTPYGFAHRTFSVLKKAGYNIKYINANQPDQAKASRLQADMSNVTYHFKFRDRQDTCLNAVMQYDQGVIHAATGFGKMAIIVMICLLYPKAKIHIVTKRLPIVNKISEYLTRYIPNVGQFGDGSKSFGDRVTVFCSKSLHHSDFDADILLCDEAHELLSDSDSQMLAGYQLTRNYGLTASPVGRLDGTDVRMEALFGKTIFHLPYWEAVNLGLVVPIHVHWYDVILSDNPAAGFEDVDRKRHGIWFNGPRNDIIAKAIEPIPHDEQFLVLTDTIFHACELYKRLAKQGRQRQLVLVYDKIDIDRFQQYKNDLIIPQNAERMTPEIKEKYRKMFEAGVIDAISTPTWEVGIDPTQLQHLVVASSFSSAIKAQQIPGRASRITDKINKTCGYVYAFRDQFDRGFCKNARSCYHTYESLRWTQLLVTNNGLVPLEW